MFKPRTFIEVCQAMQNNATVEINKRVGKVSEVQRGDGSGRNFNVLMIPVNADGSQPINPNPFTVFFTEGA